MLTLSDEAAQWTRSPSQMSQWNLHKICFIFSPIRQKVTKFQNEDGMCPPQRIWVILVLFPFGQVISAWVVLALFLMRVVSVQLGQVASAQFQRWVVSAWCIEITRLCFNKGGKCVHDISRFRRELPIWSLSSWSPPREAISPDKRFFQFCFFSLTVFQSEHFIVYGNCISGESKVSGLYQSNLMTIDAC